MTITAQQSELVRTARITGFWYFIMAVSGISGFLIVHPQIFDPSDVRKTLSKLIDQESVARIRLLLEFAIIVSQALTAVWFFKLFRHIHEWAAWSVGIWGTVNAMVIMISAIAMGSAIDLAGTSLPLDEKLIMIELLHSIITNAWGIGGLFFGLWLIPLGSIITSSGRMPLWLGRTLIIGGIGYLLSTTMRYSGVDIPFSKYLTLPATIGEFWMIGYLFVFGIRPVTE